MARSDLPVAEIVQCGLILLTRCTQEGYTVREDEEL